MIAKRALDAGFTSDFQDSNLTILPEILQDVNTVCLLPLLKVTYKSRGDGTY